MRKPKERRFRDKAFIHDEKAHGALALVFPSQQSRRADLRRSFVSLMEADTVNPEETRGSSNPILVAVSSHPIWVIVPAVIKAVIIK